MRVPRKPGKETHPSGEPVTRGSSVRSGATDESILIAHERRQFVASLVLNGAPTSQVHRLINLRACTGCEKQVQADLETCPHCTAKLSPRPLIQERRVQLLVAEVRNDLHREYQDNLATMKAEQVNRIRNDLLKMRSSSKIPWPSVVAAERLLADIVGTIPPKQQSVAVTFNDVGQTLVAVISGMSTEEAERAVQEQRELMRAAGRDVVESTGEPA